MHALRFRTDLLEAVSAEKSLLVVPREALRAGASRLGLGLAGLARARLHDARRRMTAGSIPGSERGKEHLRGARRMKGGRGVVAFIVSNLPPNEVY